MKQNNENKYYNYILLDPRKPLNWEYQGIEFKFAPFYVGKGTGNRCKHHYTKFNGENPYKENTIKILNNGGYLPTIQILNDNSSEQYALSQEIEIIKWIKNNLGDVLTNILEGGNEPPHYSGKNNPKAIKVYQYNKDTGELLNEFDCISDAVRYLGKNCNVASHISSCCKGNKRTYAGYKWSYEKLERITPNTGKYDRINFNKLIAYDNDGNELMFHSMKEAYDYFNIQNKGQINRVLKGKRSMFKSYYWRTE